jgi:hypothetical protein
MGPRKATRHFVHTINVIRSRDELLFKPGITQTPRTWATFLVFERTPLSAYSCPSNTTPSPWKCRRLVFPVGPKDPCPLLDQGVSNLRFVGLGHEVFARDLKLVGGGS